MLFCSCCKLHEGGSMERFLGPSLSRPKANRHIPPCEGTSCTLITSPARCNHAMITGVVYNSDELVPLSIDIGATSFDLEKKEKKKGIEIPSGTSDTWLTVCVRVWGCMGWIQKVNG